MLAVSAVNCQTVLAFMLYTLQLLCDRVGRLSVTSVLHWQSLYGALAGLMRVRTVGAVSACAHSGPSPSDTPTYAAPEHGVWLAVAALSPTMPLDLAKEPPVAMRLIGATLLHYRTVSSRSCRSFEVASDRRPSEIVCLLHVNAVHDKFNNEQLPQSPLPCAIRDA